MSISDMIADIDLSGQVAIVTGGGRGMGRVYARTLAKAGASVVVMARTASELDETVAIIRQADGCAIAIPADVTERKAVERAVARTEEQLGPVDLLVNNAGIAGPLGPIWEDDPEEWWRCIDVNLRGPLLCCQAVLPSMIARQKGRIVNVSSGAGNRPMPYGSQYSVSKAALTRFTENLAVEIREYGVSVFALTPGTVRTPMWEASLASRELDRWMPWARPIFQQGRDDPPEHGAHLLLFLASGRADALSGCFFHIDYNVSDMVQRAEEIQENSLYTLRLRM